MSEPLATIFKGDVLIEEGLDTTEFGFGDFAINRGLVVNTGANAAAEISLNGTLPANVSTTTGSLTLDTTDATAAGIVNIASAGTLDGASGGAIDIDATAGGISLDAVLNSTFKITSAVAAELLLETAGHIDNKITIHSDDSTQAESIKLSSDAGGIVVTTDTSVAADSIKVESQSGGILIDANGGDTFSPISIQTDDTTNGVSVATVSAGVPVTIGTPTSVTTVVGDFVVQGDTTTVNTATVTVEDNIILTNSGPLEISDGGVAVKRWQAADTGAAGVGEVIGDTPTETSAIHTADGVTLSITASTVANPTVLSVVNSLAGTETLIISGHDAVPSINGTYAAGSYTFDGTTVTLTGVEVTIAGTATGTILPVAEYAITSSSVANPTVVTTATQSLTGTETIIITGHTGSTPDINGTYASGTYTVTSTTTVELVGINVTVGGTGGSLYTEQPAGFSQAGGTASTIVLNANANATDDYYNGWWITIIDATGVLATHRVKDYVGSTQTATIFATADYVDPLVDPTAPIPREAYDFVVDTSVAVEYELFNCPYVVSIFDESKDEWALGYTAQNPATTKQVDIQKYVDLHVCNLQVDCDLTVVGKINGIQLDIVTVVTLIDNSTANVEIPVTEAYGAYFISVKEVATNDVAGDTVLTGAFATFSCSSQKTKAGHVVRLSAARGADNERVDIDWPANDKIQLNYRPAPGGAGAPRYYVIKVNRLY